MSQINPVSAYKAEASESSKASKTSAHTTDFASYLGADSTLDAIFDKAASTYNVPKELLLSVAKTESNFDSNAVSYCGATGIMQLMPATAASLGVADSYDPEQNIMGGAKLLSQLLDKYNNNQSLALAAYNAGGGNVDKYGGIPPFTETQNYVVKVLGYMDQGVTAPDTAVSSSTNNSYQTTPSIYEDGALYQVDTTATSLAEDIFNYEDYLQFLDIYFDNILAKNSLGNTDNENNSSTEKDSSDEKENNNYYQLQSIKYNNSVLNLLNNQII